MCPHGIENVRVVVGRVSEKHWFEAVGKVLGKVSVPQKKFWGYLLVERSLRSLGILESDWFRTSASKRVGEIPKITAFLASKGAKTA